jgi:hypothetical protein
MGPTFPIPIQHSPGISSQCKKEEEEMKGIQIDKEVVKLSLFTDYIILYLKDPKKLHPKTPRLCKQLQQHIRIQNQFTKISSLSIHQQ